MSSEKIESVNTDQPPKQEESSPLVTEEKQEGWCKKHRKVVVPAITITCFVVSVVIFGTFYALLQTKEETLKIFSYHTERIYQEKNGLFKKEVCVEAPPEYDKNYEFFLSACDNEKLHVVNSLVNITSVTSPVLNYYFKFEENSFINVTAEGGHVYYRYSNDAKSANKLNEETCHGLEKLEHNFVNITNNPLQIFQKNGYYHICFDRDDTKASSFEMSTIEFYNDIPEQERMNCTDISKIKNEKCCHDISLGETHFCIYFFSGSNTFDPVTQLNPLTLRINYNDGLYSVPIIMTLLALIAVVVVIIGCVLLIWKTCKNGS